MKKAKILGVGLSLMLLVSLFGFAIPMGVGASAPGEQQWDYGYEPYYIGYKTAKNSEIKDFAINGLQVYLVGEYGSSTSGRVFRSTNEGFSWSHKTTFKDTIGGVPTSVAVASDDKLAIAVSDGTDVWISSDEGDSYVKLTRPTTLANTTITDIAVGPKRSGLLIGREYAVSIQCDTGADTTGGDVLLYGNGGWESAGSGTGIVNTRDYVTVQFSPNFAGDRVLLTVGANTTAITYQAINSATKNVIDDVDLLTGVTLDVGGTLEILAGDIAAPTDYDPSSTNGNMVFVSTASGDADDDVFKVTPNAGTAVSDQRKALLSTSADVHSVAYGGTVDSGTLFIGLQGNAGTTGLNAISGSVRRCLDPHVSQPTWKTAIKNPTGASPVVRLADGYGSFGNEKVLAATTLLEGAMNISDDNGVTFYQASMIDNGENGNIGSMLDVAVTSDESAVWVLTNDEDNQAALFGDLHLWEKQGTNASSTGWARHWTLPQPSTTVNCTGLLAINPDWETTPAIYIVNNTDANSASNIYVSKNGGATWSTRTGPGAMRVQSIVLSDADTVHVVVNDVYFQSTNAAWTWTDGEAADSKATVGSGYKVNTIVAPNGDIMNAGKSMVGLSTDNGVSFSQKSTGLPSNVDIFIAVDADYATNKLMYVGGSNGRVYRMGSSAVWEDISSATIPITAGETPGMSGAIVDMAFRDGVMYAMTSNSCLRNMEYDNPSVAKAAAGWQDMDKEPAGTSSYYVLSGKNNVINLLLTDTNMLWSFGAQDDTWAYRDTLATEVPALTSPPDGYELAVDTVTGNGEAFTFQWETLGTGGSVPDEFQVEVKEVGGVSSLGNAFDVDDPATPQVSSTTATVSGYTFRANKDYQWRLRVTDTVSGDAIRSAWTDWQNLSVGSGTKVQQTQAGPILLGPQGGAMTSLMPGFTWAPVPGATEYEFILATDATLTQTIANTPVALTSPAFSVAAELDEGTTYFWAVRSSKPTVGQQAINTFTTRAPSADAVAPAPPADIIVNVPPIEIPETPATPAAPAVSDGILYTIIGIGAILIIAVLVLIVRTRRPL